MAPFLPNPYWTALETEQSSIALGDALARRFPPDVIPFAGVREPTPEAVASLHRLLAPGEVVYITGTQHPAHPGLSCTHSFPGLQMHHTGPVVPLPETSPAQPIEVLSGANAAEMVALTDVAYPGYFCQRTYTLGTYLGIRSPTGQLIAMCGERLAVPGRREISAVCTHPAHTGRGYAARLITDLLQRHQAAGLGSFLGVTGSNHRAIALYERLGFHIAGEIVWNRFERRPAQTPGPHSAI